nr:membrane protein, probable [Kibdelosporangium sp. MJ126-NF4]CTQ92521.1 membrane protein, probable [Kibdelosporangium sp. MJ126-NF4]
MATEVATVLEKPAFSVVATMALAQFGLYVGLMAPVTVSLALKTQTIVGPDRAPSVNANVLAVAVLVAMVANPVFGRLSDRTMSRFGRRRPWIVGGAIAFLLSLGVVATAKSVPILLIGWCLAQMAASAIMAAVVATVVDQVPSRQRGSVSANLGAMQSLGVLGAAYVGEWFVDNMFALFVVPGVFALVVLVLYAVVLPDRQLPVRPPAADWRTLLRTFWVNPRQYPDFAWAWLSRLLLVLSVYLFVLFRFFYLQKEIGLSTREAAAAMSTGVLIFTVALMITAKLGGWLSDQLGRRKMFVVVATLVFAAGLAILAHASTVTGFYVAEVVLGVGYGVYVAVDSALVIAVLPSAAESAKDLGVMNIANALPQSLAAVLGSALLSVGAGDNYPVLLWSAGAIGVLAALTILPIRSVR